MMSASADMPRPLAARVGTAVLVTGILLAGGVSGMVFNNVFASSEPALDGAAIASVRVKEVPSGTALSLARSVPTAAVPPETAAEPAPGARMALGRKASVIVAPPDPFQPSRTSQAPFSVASGELTLVPGETEPATEQGGAGIESLEGPRKSSAPAPAVQGPPPDSLAVVGIIQGDPSLAVVQFEGQSFYLKVGDQVADTWRLEQIKERSAVFQLGAQRVEVPIKGGSS